MVPYHMILYQRSGGLNANANGEREGNGNGNPYANSFLS